MDDNGLDWEWTRTDVACNCRLWASQPDQVVHRNGWLSVVSPDGIRGLFSPISFSGEALMLPRSA